MDYGVSKIAEDQRWAEIHAWQCGQIEGLQTETYDGFHPVKLANGKTVFRPHTQRMVETLAKSDATTLRKEFRTIFYYDEHCIAYVPFHHSNDGVTPNGSAPTSINKARREGFDFRACRMSAIHLIVVPRKRIFNAISITVDDLPLIFHMQRTGCNLALALATADSFPPPPPKGLEEKIESRVTNLDAPMSFDDIDAFSKAVSLGKYDHMMPNHQYLPGGLNMHPSVVGALFSGPETMLTFFETHPNQSDGWLQMHVIAPQLLTNAGYEYFLQTAEHTDVAGILTPVSNAVAWTIMKRRWDTLLNNIGTGAAVTMLRAQYVDCCACCVPGSNSLCVLCWWIDGGSRPSFSPSFSSHRIPSRLTKLSRRGTHATLGKRRSPSPRSTARRSPPRPPPTPPTTSSRSPPQLQRRVPVPRLSPRRRP